MVSSFQKTKVRSSNHLLNSIHIGDFVLLTASLLTIFSYGQAWTGLTAAQLVQVRMAVAVLCTAAIILKMLHSSFTRFEWAAIFYAGLLVIVGFFAPISPGNAVLQGLDVALMALVPSYFARKYGSRSLLHVIFWIFLVLVIAVDAFAFASGWNGVMVQENEWVFTRNYIFGSKFTFAYINMFFFGIAACILRNRMALIALGLVGMFFCSMTGCSTGVVGIALMAVVIIIGDERSFKAWMKWLVPGVIAAMSIVVVVAPGVMQLPLMQSIIVDSLGESSDISGRLTIYPHLLDLWLQSPLLGFGSNGGANLAVMQACGAPDAQEGLFHILLSNGLIGGILFLLLCFSGLSPDKTTDLNINGLYAFVLSMSFCSLVEINLGSLFILGVSLAHALSGEEQTFSSGVKQHAFEELPEENRFR